MLYFQFSQNPDLFWSVIVQFWYKYHTEKLENYNSMILRTILLKSISNHINVFKNVLENLHEAIRNQKPGQMLDNDDERYNSSNDVPIPENQVTLFIDDIQHQNTQSVVLLLCSGITKWIEGTFCHFWKSGVQWPIFFYVVSRFNQASTEPSCPKFVIISSKSSESVV